MIKHLAMTEMIFTDKINIEKIKEILKGFRERTKIISSILYTHDGTIIFMDSEKSLDDKSNNRLIGVVYSNIMALAEHSIFKIEEGNRLKQISIQAGEQLDSIDGIKVILESVRENIFLLVMIPTSLNIGVFFFELNNIIRKINNEIA